MFFSGQAQHQHHRYQICTCIQIKAKTSDLSSTKPSDEDQEFNIFRAKTKNNAVMQSSAKIASILPVTCCTKLKEISTCETDIVIGAFCASDSLPSCGINF